MAYGLSNGHVTVDVTWPQKCCETVQSAILATVWLASCFLYVSSGDYFIVLHVFSVRMTGDIYSVLPTSACPSSRSLYTTSLSCQQNIAYVFHFCWIIVYHAMLSEILVLEFYPICRVSIRNYENTDTWPGWWLSRTVNWTIQLYTMNTSRAYFKDFIITHTHGERRSVSL